MRNLNLSDFQQLNEARRLLKKGLDKQYVENPCPERLFSVEDVAQWITGIRPADQNTLDRLCIQHRKLDLLLRDLYTKPGIRYAGCYIQIVEVH